MVTIEPTFQWRDASHGGSMQARAPCPLCLCMKQNTVCKTLFRPSSSNLLPPSRMFVSYSPPELV